MPASFRNTLIGGLAGALVLFVTSPAPAESWRLRIKENGAISAPTFVVTEVQGDLTPGSYESSDAGLKEVSAYRDQDRLYLVFLREPSAEAGSAPVTIRRDSEMALADKRDKSIENWPLGTNVPIRLDGQEVTTYHAAEGPKPYFYPINGPGGRRFTRSYPMKQVEGEDRDHPHQRSFWFTHGAVNGFDFWASDPLNKPNPKFGSIKETSRKILADSKRLGVLRTTDDWLGPDGKKVCEDERTVLFAGTGDLRIIDFDITIKATASPVTFGDTKEGMFGLRVPSSMDVKRKQGGKITNAEGITDNDAWGKPSPWVDYTGPVEGKTAGIAILNHPESFRYPTTWHVRDYGLFAANPFGWHDFGMKKSGEHTIPSGASIRFRYRVLLHDGDTTSANIPGAFNAYAKPPAVVVEKE
jgi:hypothetical protein